MAFISYRGATVGTAPASTTSANVALTNAQIDGNWKSLDQYKLENSGYTTGDIFYANGSGVVTALAKSTDGFMLKLSGGFPSWSNPVLADISDSWIKKAVKCATTANITLSGIQTIDNVVLLANDRILVKDQTTPSQNGIYVVASGTWTRATDANSSSKIAGSIVYADQGTANGGKRFTTSFKSSDTIDTTALYWSRPTDTSASATWSFPTAAVGIDLALDGGSQTIPPGGLADLAINSIGQKTIASTGASTYTRASSLYIAGAPVAGTNATMTNAYALYIAAGANYLAGATTIAGDVSLTSTTDSSSTTTGALKISGGAGISKNLYVGGNLVVNGTTTTINSNTLAVDDKNIELGSVSQITGLTATLATGTAVVTVASTAGMIPGQSLTATAGPGAFGASAVIASVDSATQFTANVNHATAGAVTFNVGGASDATANGGGLTLLGATNKTLNWSSTSTAWESSEHISVATNKTYEVNGTAVLSASAALQNATTANFADAATTISLGNTATAAQTVNLFGASTGTSTYKFAGGATANATTKTIEIGLNGVAGSTTSIAIGSTAGTSTTTLNGVVKIAGLTSNAVVTTSGGTGQLGTTAASSLAFTTGSLSLAGNLSTSGAYAVTLSFPGAFTYTYPGSTSTLLATNGSGSSLTFGGTGTLSLGNNSLTVSTNSGTLSFGAATKTLTVNNSIALSGSDATTMTFPTVSTTVAGLSIAQTFSVKQTFAAPSASVSGSINLPSGSANTPVTGDLYNAGNVLYFHNGTAAKTIAYTDSSITGSAATLTTSRNIWGQSFNGSGNVTGAMSSVGSITFATGADYVIDHADEAAQRNLTIGGHVNNTGASGIGGTVTIRGGESSSTSTAATGGNVAIYGGIASTTGAITKTGGSVYIEGGGAGASGTITYGSVYIGTQANGTSTGTTSVVLGNAANKTPITVNGFININRVTNTTHGIQWYSSTYDTWQTYMGQAATTSIGTKGSLTVPTGSLVTSWGLRNYIEDTAGYGWTWESGTGSTDTTPTIVAELRSSDGSMKISGDFYAKTKSFLIDHPTKEGMKLHYGSLEGPEHGVYVRGRLKGNNVIELPEYWIKLVDESTITVQLTAIGKSQKLYVEDIVDNKVYVANDGLFAGEINCFYFIQAERADIDKLEVEIA